MIQICVLASGSRGNSVYFNADGCECLIDVGLSLKALERRLDALGTSPSRLSHVFLTHEHDDHISGLFRLAARHPIQVHLSQSLYLMLSSQLPSTRVMLFDDTYEVDNIEVTPFSIMHDAIDPVGFTFTQNASKFGVMTDVGHVSNLAHDRLKGCNVLVLEANHDEESLWHGSYPWPLKQRIGGRMGHLSNRQAGECLKSVWKPGLHTVVLAHLSEENNRPELAIREVEQAVRRVTAVPPRVFVAQQRANSELVTIR